MSASFAAHRTSLLWPAAMLLCSLCGCSFSSTSASVQQAPAPPLQFIGSWGVKGTDPGQLDDPSGIATDVRGNVYIADPGSQYIDKFQAGGTPLLAFQEPRLKHPQSIATDRGGAIYVSDPVRASVFVFLPDGSRYREIRVQARPNEENMLNVAVSDDGSLSILDVNGGKVFDFSPSFRLQHVWKPGDATPGGAGRAHSITSGPADAIYVGGLGGSSLLRYYDGKFTAQIDLGGDPPGERLGDDFAVSQNYIFLPDANGHTLHVWTLDGKPKADADLSAQLGTSVHSALPIAASPQGDIFLLDTANARVLRYRANL